MFAFMELCITFVLCVCFVSLCISLYTVTKIQGAPVLRGFFMSIQFHMWKSLDNKKGSVLGSL
jgi:hypothetical protein